MAITIKINGTDREIAQYSLNLSATLGERATFNCRVISTSGSYRPEQGHPIELWEGGSKLWAGTVDEVAEVSITEAGSAAGAFYDIRGVSWEQRLDRRRCYDITTSVPAVYDRNFVFTADASTNTVTTVGNHGRSNGDRVRVKAHAQGALCGGLNAEIEYYVISASASTLQLSLTAGGSAVDITDTGTLDQILITYRAGEIVADLVNTFAGLESIGTTNIDLGAVVDTIAFEAEATVSEAIGQLAALSNFVWWIDDDRELFFKPRTYAAAPFSISASSGNYRSLAVRRTREDKVNSALVGIDWSQIPLTTQSFTGDGSARTFTLSNRCGLLHSITLDGQDVDFGVWLAESDRAWYWQYGSTTIRQDVDDDVLTAANTLEVKYYQLGANTVLEEDSSDISSTASQEGSGSGRYQHYYERNLGQVQAALDAQALIAAKKSIVTEIQYETDQQVEPLCVTLRPGQLQTIANAARGISSASYLIREVSIIDVGGAWLKFTVKAITGTALMSTADYWRAVAGVGQTSTSATGAGGSSSGSTPLPAAPDNVTSVSATYEYADEETIRVKIAYTAPSPLGNFVGVHVWEEPVDQSASGAIPLNSTALLNSTRNLGGTFAPIDRGYHLTSPATIYIPRPAQNETKRFYLASYSETAENELVRATETNATPNVTVAITANNYQAGEEYARLVTGVTASVEYDDSQVASPKYRLIFGWTAPADPPAAWQRAFGGVQVVYEYSNGNRANGPALNVNETTARSDWFDLFVGTNPIRVWFVSMDASEEPRINTIVTGLTPSAVATVTWPLASRPSVSQYADNVTGFAASNARYVTNAAGQKALLIDLAWTKPSGAAALARWGGAVVWLHLPTGEKFQMTGAETGTAVTIESSAFPQSTVTWTFYAVSLDNNANPNTDGRSPAVGTPSATISVSPPAAGAAGTEYTSHVTGAAFSAATVSASDGTTQQRITATFSALSDVTWGGVELRVYDGATLLASTSATPSPIAVVIPNPSTSTTVTAKLVSYDVNGRTNTEVATTPQGNLLIGSNSGTFDLTKYLPSSTDLFTISSGKIIVAANQITETAIASNAISTPKLQAGAVTANIIAAGAVIAGKIAANAVAATEIAAGAVTSVKLDATQINVGGGGSKPGKFAVYNSSGSQVGFIGVDGSDEGGWFKTLSVGGTSYGTGVIKTNSSGQITIDFAAANNSNNKILISQTTYDTAYTTAGIRIQNGTAPAAGSDTTWFISRGMVVYGSGNYQGNYYAVTVNRDPTSTGAGEVVVYGGTSTSYIRLSGSDGRCRADGGFAVGASAGVSTSISPVTGINTTLVSAVTGISTTTQTIQYLDWSSTPKTSPAFVTVVTPSTSSVFSFSSTVTTTYGFSGGIRTS